MVCGATERLFGRAAWAPVPPHLPHSILVVLRSLAVGASDADRVIVAL
jgi:hypothetical protein